jgi:hypothetical protein
MVRGDRRTCPLGQSLGVARGMCDGLRDTLRLSRCPAPDAFERRWPRTISGLKSVYVKRTDGIHNFLSCRGLVEVPDNVSGGANSAGGIFARLGLRFVAKSREDFSFVCAGNEKQCVPPAVQNYGSESQAIRWIGRRADGSDPVLFFLQRW